MPLFTDSIPFYKMHGCGNDFIIIDNRELKLDPDEMGNWAGTLCRRGFGIYADGLFFLDTPPENTDLSYIWYFFNRDGSAGEMCGNASRCAARLAHAIGMAPADHVFGTSAGPVRARVIETGHHAGEVRVRLPLPADIALDTRLYAAGQSFNVHHVTVGVPHAVIFTQDVDAIDICRIGRAIRHHDHFAPAGVNVNFSQVIDRRTIKLRTFERGVEDETFACGTGAASAQFLSHLLGNTDTPATVRTVTGPVLTVDVSGGDLYLQGPAELTFKGEFYPLSLGLQLRKF